MNEHKQWQLFLQGEEQALAYLYRRYYNDLLNYGIKLSGNKDVADDSIQDMFLKLWRNRQHIANIDYIKPYLLKVLRRHIQINLDINTRFTHSFSQDIFSLEFSAEDFLIKEEVDSEMRQKILRALNLLSTRQREAIYLRFFEGLEYESIAHIMEMNLQSVRNIIFRGMKTLRDLLLLKAFFLLRFQILF